MIDCQDGTQENRMAHPPDENTPAPGKSSDLGYGKIDAGKSRDIMAEVGKSKGQQNNSGDFGNGEDGATGATGEDKVAGTVAAVPAKEKTALATEKAADVKDEDDYPA
jgi:hypothetical protein